MSGRIKESDLLLPTLRLLSESPNGFLTTADLISALAEVFNPGGKDAQMLEDRQDTYFSQKVRNMVSHRGQKGNVISQGYAEYLDEGLKITDSGRIFLKTFTDVNSAP